MTKRTKETGVASQSAGAPAEPPLSGDVRDPGWKLAPQPAASFYLPKFFPTTAQILRLPKMVPEVRITHRALHKILIIVGAIEMEVGWLGTARRDGDHFVIEDIFLFRQDVSYGHSELENLGDIMVQDILPRPDGEDIFNNTRFWGHSHGNGSTIPSQQDDTTMDTFEQFGADFFIRGIFNRIGGASFSVYDWKKGTAFHNTPWKLTGKPLSGKTYDQLLADLPKEMREKVTYAPPPITPHQNQHVAPRGRMLPVRYPSPNHLGNVWDPRTWFNPNSSSR